MKKLSIILVILALCLAVTACAEPAEETADDVLGVINGATYENTVLGIGCTLEGWKYYTQEEILDINKMTADVLSEDVKTAMEALGTVNAMVAQTPDGMTNVNVQIQYSELVQTTAEVLGMNALAEASLPQFKQTLEYAGYTDIEISTGEITIGGQTFTTIQGSYVLNGIPMNFRQFLVISDGYFGNVTCTSAMGDKSDEVFANFYLLP